MICIVDLKAQSQVPVVVFKLLLHIDVLCLDVIVEVSEVRRLVAQDQEVEGEELVSIVYLTIPG